MTDNERAELNSLINLYGIANWATRNTTHTDECRLRWQVRQDATREAIVAFVERIEANAAIVAETPGLGVTVEDEMTDSAIFWANI